jgi:UTP--glucose-1-phosphate uridylyltransferase
LEVYKPKVYVSTKNMGFANELSRRRKTRKLKIAQLARASGLTAGHISRLEKGLRRPSEEVVRRLAAALDSSPIETEELITTAGFQGSDDPNRRDAPDHALHSKEIRAACASLLATPLSQRRTNIEAAFEQALDELNALRKSLLCPIREAIVPLAGGQHRLFAQHAIQRLMTTAVAEAMAAGISRVVFVLPPEIVESTFGPLRNTFSLRAKHYWELAHVVQEQPLGLGHAVFCCRGAISGDRFAVMLPDDVIPIPQHARHDDLANMIEVAEEDNCDVVLAALRLPRTLRHGGLAVLGPERIRPRVWPVTQLVERPNPDHPAMAAHNGVSVVGRYVLSRSIFDAMAEIAAAKPAKMELTDAIELLRGRNGTVLAWQLAGERIDVGLTLEEATRVGLLEEK